MTEDLSGDEIFVFGGMINLGLKIDKKQSNMLVLVLSNVALLKKAWSQELLVFDALHQRQA